MSGSHALQGPPSVPWPASKSSGEPESGYIPFFANGCYYPNWRIYKQQSPSSFSIGYVSHIFYAFAHLREDGSVYLSDEYADSEIEVDGTRGCIRAFTQLKQQYTELKVILSVGGGGQASHPFAVVAANPEAAERFAASARQLVNEYGLDGIDVDWEHPSKPQEGIDYVYLLSRLRHHLPFPHYILASALPAGEWALKNINLAAAQSHLDFINLMAYDFSGPWAPECGHHAQLFSPSAPYSHAASLSCQSAVEYMIAQGVPAKKILLGIPVYGRSFVGAKKVGDQYTEAAGDEGTYDFRDLVNSGVAQHNDNHVGAAFCHHGEGGFVSFDNVQTVKMKAEFAVQNQLRGLFYWHIAADARGSSSLIKTGYNTLHGF